MEIWQKILLFLDNFNIPNIGITDVIEIVIMTILIYKIMKNLKSSRTFILVKAISLLFIVYLIAELFAFHVITVIFQGLAIISLFAVIVIFQPEIRKTLEKLGTIHLNKFSLKEILNVILNRSQQNETRYSDDTIDQLVKACFELSKTKTGALIVMQGDIPLDEYISTGINLNADISSALLINIFEKNTPLHDGAVIATGNKLIAGTCYLPLSKNPDISKHLGTRHRAGIGITEAVDCSVLIVSEETGQVSYVYNGEITVCDTPDKLRKKLVEKQKKAILLKKKRKIELNFSLRISSIFIAIFAWLLIINTIDPVTTKTFYNVPVQIVNQDVIENIDKTFNVVSGDTVDVVVKDSKSIVDELSITDIVVTADMSKLSYVYSVPLAASTKYASTEISFIGENTLTVELDDVISKEFSLTFKKVGNASAGIYVSKIVSDVDGIIVTGPKTIVETIDRVEFEVNISGATENFSKLVKPVIYDKNGTVVDSNLYELNKTEVQVSAELLNTKLIPAEITLAESENIQYELSIANYTPTNIYIASTDEKLAEIESLPIEIKSEMDASISTQETFVKEINIVDYLPEGVYCVMEDTKINIELLYKPFVTKTITFYDYDLTVNNKPENCEIFFKNNKFTIDIIGKESVVKNLTIKDFAPYIDLKDLKAGSYNLKVMFNSVNEAKPAQDLSIDIEIKETKTK